MKIAARVPRRHSAGVALVIVLAFVVLVTILITAFFSRSILNRQIAGTSVAQMKAENVAAAAMNIITSDLKQEINAGSKADGDPSGTSYTTNGVRIYVPKSNKAAVAARIGTDDTLTNLVRRSVRSADAANPESFPSQTNSFPSTAYDSALLPKNRASAVSSLTPSLNQRFVSQNRWNKPLLLSSTTPPAGFVSPDWVLVTRGGPKSYSAWNSSLKDSTASNPNFVVGRYAYTIYDEGGLIDITLAGFPSSLQSEDDFRGKRGRIGQIQLNDIPGIANGSALVAWRNAATGNTAAAYKSYLFAHTPQNAGFLNTLPGDQTFISRQDLLTYQSENPSVLSKEALQYLGTFTREKNAPTFTPDPNRSKVQPGNTYHDEPGWNADPPRGISSDPGNPNSYGDDDKFNPSLVATRNSTGSSRISRRFPLSRLSLLTSSGPAPGVSAADIKQYFGLVWDSSTDTWSYISPDGSGTSPANIIKFLKNIPGDREPDFFETLQAAIHLGSLGRDSDGMQYYKPSFEPGTSSTSRVESRNVYYQIMQIGANIIDQGDSDSYPTVIQFGAETIAGIEDLPYTTRIFDHIYRSPLDPNTVSGEYVFEIWNPHQDITPTGGVPTDFRIVGKEGGAQLVVSGQYALTYPISGLPPVLFSTTNSSDYRSPVRLGTGFVIGTVVSPSNFVAYIFGNPHSTFALQYRNANGKWVEYQKIRRIQWQIKESFYIGTGYAEWFHQRVDPRTDRFGTSMNYLPGDNPLPGNFGPTVPVGSTVRPAAADGNFLSENSPFASQIFFYSGGQNSFNAAKNSALGAISDNTMGSRVYYKDPDGEVRAGDGAYRSGVDGQPMAAGNFASRPVILNRPFRSVGELAYAFRDLPFKSLDFFTVNSGDAALLDAFSLDDAEVVAGHININTRQVPVLSALLSGATKVEGTPSTAITAAEAQTIAAALVARTTDPTKGPLLNRSDVVTKFGPDITYSDSTSQRIKTQREAAVRVLAETANLRTWNFLVDVIAQSGRYPVTSAGLQDFLVEGERRYWMHIAIDRYTGEVVDQRLESVNE